MILRIVIDLIVVELYIAVGISVDTRWVKGTIGLQGLRIDPKPGLIGHLFPTKDHSLDQRILILIRPLNEVGFKIAAGPVNVTIGGNAGESSRDLDAILDQASTELYRILKGIERKNSINLLTLATKN